MFSIDRKSDGTKYGGTYTVTAADSAHIDAYMASLDARNSTLRGHMTRIDDTSLSFRLTNRREADALHTVAADVQRDLERRQQSARQAPTEQAPRRVLVATGTVQPGDTLCGHTVRGLGRAFPSNEDHVSYVYGLEPGDEGRPIQYAYFR